MVAPYIAYDGPIVARDVAVERGLVRYFTGLPCKRGHISERFTLNLTCARCCVEQHDARREVIKEQARRRRRDEPEKYRAKDKAERLANPDGARAKGIKWRNANLARSLAMAKAWKQRNGERVKAYKDGYNAANADDLKVKRAEYRAANLAAIKAKKVAKYAAAPEKDRAYSRAWYAANAAPSKARHRVWVGANPRKQVEYEARRRARKVQAGGDHTAADVQRIGDAQKWQCHWCGKPTKHKYHVDHIRPLSKGGGNGPDNLAVTCAPCNQRKWAADPIEFARRIGLLV